MQTKTLTTMTRRIGALSLVALLTAFAGVSQTAFGQSASDAKFKVRLDFNRWHDYDELKADMLTLAEAYPKFLTYSSLGESHGGREIMMMTINNPDTGPGNEQIRDVHRGKRSRQ